MTRFAPLQNDILLRAMLREPTPYTPVWLMRQAGRYLPEYRATRERAGSFLGVAKNPELATEVALQPLERYPLDAAILFSDILTVPDAMGLGLRFIDGDGPKFSHPLRNEKAVHALRVPDMADLQYVFDAVTQTRLALQGRVPLIGFSGSPWTLACYMVEGSGSSDFHKTKAMLYSRPDLMHHLLAINADAVAAYLNAQVDAGAQALMLFDTWGGILASGLYQQFSLHYIRRIITQLQREKDGARIPVLVFARGCSLWLNDIADCGADAVGLDWTADLALARKQVGHKVALQGHLDPAVLFAPDAAIRAETERVLNDFGAVDGGYGHIFNLGHGISQFTPPDAVACMIETVHAASRKMHR